jgi:hypothetical protein
MSKTWLIALALIACKKNSDPGGTTGGASGNPPAGSAMTAPAGSAGSGSAVGSAAAGSATGDRGSMQRPPDVIKDVGLATPESILYDADSDTYLVSNINGKPADSDDNGFISKLSPDGKMIDLKWIDGARTETKLDAPKGTAISGGVLWVADITVVRKFDPKTGKSVGEVKIPGSTFLNDVAPAADGGVYVTDTGVDASFKPTGADAVYQIAKDGKIKTLAKNKDLGGPNGITEVAGTIYVVTFRTGEIMTVPRSNEKPWKLPKGQLDGIVALGKDDLLVSSWEGKTVYRGAPMGPWKDLKLDIEGPADIGWDSKRRRLLVPSFNGNTITMIDL